MLKFLSLALVLAFTLSIVAEDDAAMQKAIEQIKQIQKITRSTSWEPGVTDVAKMSKQEVMEMCGLYPVLGYQAANPDTDSDVQVLGYVDLREKGVVTPIRNQQRCGSCWAFAAVACMEIVLGGNADLSEQQLVSCCTSSSGCNGGYIDSTFRWAINNGGLVTESVYPYTSGGGQTGTCQQKSGQKFNISSYSNVSSNSAVKSALDRGIPVDTGMQVYDDFRYYKNGVYKYTSGNYLGGHAVAIVGYNDSEGCWIVKNSWGTGWGEQGYFRIAYDECSMPWMAAYAKR